MKSYFFVFLAGVAAGILIAPYQGSETRRKIRQAYDDAHDGLNRLANKATEKIEDAAVEIDARLQSSV